MSYWSILFGLLPLLLFVIMDSFFGPKVGIIAAGVAAIAELILSYSLFQSVDALTLGSVFLVLVMGYTAWKMKNPTIFKMQPVVMGLAMAFVLLISYTIDQPILTLLITKYKDHMPEEFIARFMDPQFIMDPQFKRFLDLATLYGGWAILAQAGLVAWAALKLNNWWWIAFRAVGFYAFFLVAIFLAKYHAFQ